TIPRATPATRRRTRAVALLGRFALLGAALSGVAPRPAQAQQAQQAQAQTEAQDRAAALAAAAREVAATMVIPADGATLHGVSGAALVRLYEGPAARPLWTGDAGPTAQARQAVSALEGSATRGLRPDDYGSAR